MGARTPTEPVPARRARHRRHLIRRQLQHGAIAVGVLGFFLGFGMVGYRYLQPMSWSDAFLNAAMLLGGMGPVQTDLSPRAKPFAGVYALICGLVLIGLAGLLLTPWVHHLMRKVHWEDEEPD